eukprot:scaffold62781_cov32-Phaeocystis_antarctica.AAC.1
MAAPACWSQKQRRCGTHPRKADFPLDGRETIATLNMSRQTRTQETHSPASASCQTSSCRQQRARMLLDALHATRKPGGLACLGRSKPGSQDRAAGVAAASCLGAV